MTRMGKTLLVLSSVAAAAALALVFMPVEKPAPPKPQLTPVQKAELAPPPKAPVVTPVPPPPPEDSPEDNAPQPEIVEDGEGS